MEPHSPRFSDTPPGSPKSCMKGSRKLTFDKPPEAPGSSPIPSPKKSPKSVRMQEGNESARVTSFDTPSSSGAPPVQKKAAPAPVEIQFQFQLTEHFDQSTPPPNCTSNGNYDFVQQEDDPRKDPQLVEIATKFVNDIIEKAKIEAANRSKAEQVGAPRAPGTSSGRDPFVNGMGRGAGGWYRRAHGLVSKWITNICVKAQNMKADLK